MSWGNEDETGWARKFGWVWVWVGCGRGRGEKGMAGGHGKKTVVCLQPSFTELFELGLVILTSLAAGSSSKWAYSEPSSSFFLQPRPDYKILSTAKMKVLFNFSCMFFSYYILVFGMNYWWKKQKVADIYHGILDVLVHTDFGVKLLHCISSCIAVFSNNYTNSISIEAPIAFCSNFRCKHVVLKRNCSVQLWERNTRLFLVCI